MACHDYRFLPELRAAVWAVHETGGRVGREIAYFGGRLFLLERRWSVSTYVRRSVFVTCATKESKRCH